MARLIKLAAAVIIAGAFFSGAEARQWRATPQSLAQDYVQILDVRSPEEIVMIFWVSPLLAPEGPGSDAARQVLERYMVVAVIHADISPLGAFNFRSPQGVSLKLDQAPARLPLDDSQLDVESRVAVQTLQTVFEGAFGPMGSGTDWIVFDG